MMGLRRLDHLQRSIETIFADRIKGDLIECGVWRGGAGLLMRALCVAYREDERRLILADSYEGFPEPQHQEDLRLFPISQDRLNVGLAEVQDAFRLFNLDSPQVRFLKGFFDKTLPALKGRSKWALIRADGDLYVSTKSILESLYDDLQPGGILIVDDYSSHPPCRTAVDEFRRAQGITEPMQGVDWTAVWWRKDHAVRR